ncbi:hypothetical protein P842_01133 [Enterobacter roggenkampii UCI 39]|uniref:hypothetical protein n=1 Tax=Enterobacter roggenkampii TaxID=1812935 RepID=UPI00045359C2|nr:hypothetical protein [Enterobacter roggenkampii]EUL65306.1 hypothetical protein P842_01133 [Enterobacter roggenkampii UCI 39]
MINNAILQLIVWATLQLTYLNAIPEKDTWEKDLWIDLAYLIQQCGNLLNIDSQVDPFDMIAEAREIKDRMEAVRGTDEWTLMINQIRSLDSDWDDDWDGDEESPN